MEDVTKKIVIATVVKAMHGDPTSTVIGAALDAVWRTVSNRVEEYRRDKEQHAFTALINEIAAIDEFATNPSAELQNIIAEADEATLDTFLEYFRELSLAIDPAAKPFIARLTAPYLVHKTARDRFFRRAAALLVEVDSGDVGQLEQAFLILYEATQEFAHGNVPAVTLRQTINKLTITVGEGPDTKQLERNVDVGQAIKLLNDARLGAPGGGIGPTLATIQFPPFSTELSKLIRLFGPRSGNRAETT